MVMNNFFNTKGPIKPQSMMPAQAMVNAPMVMMGSSKGFSFHQRPGDARMQMDP